MNNNQSNNSFQSINRALFLMAMLTAGACSFTGCSGKASGSSSGVVGDNPSLPIRLISFCHQHDHIIEQARGETDEAFAQGMLQGGHGDARNEVQRRRQQILAAGTTSQLRQDLHTLNEWRQAFQRDADSYAMKAAEWCGDLTSSAAQVACSNYRRFQHGSEGRLRIVNECIAQLERRAGLPPSTSNGSANGDAADRTYQEEMQRVEEEYREKMKQIDEEEKKWNREKREQDAGRSGNPYQ